MTGGSKGIDAATCEFLVADGVRVVITGRSLESAEQLAERLGENAMAVAADCTDPFAVEAMREEIEARMGLVELLAALARLRVLHARRGDGAGGVPTRRNRPARA